jgi:molybdopterin/thiamine biosynthesis adenylyltransferase
MRIRPIVDRTRDRYSSLSISSIWEIAKIRRASAIVVGAGALGNEVSKNLAMMGVERIFVVDRDTVEVANLTRSVFFREEDHGRPKVAVLAERLRELNPGVEVTPLHGDLEAVLGLGRVRRTDLIFSCLDNRLARRSLNRMCQKVARAWVDGAMENLLGDVTVYHPDHGPCYECNLTPGERLMIAQAVSCRGLALANIALGKVPTVSTMGSIIAALQVQEALKLLHGQSDEKRAGTRLVINCEANDFYATRTARKEPCDGHYRLGEVTEVGTWSQSSTCARDLLDRFAADTGEQGHVRLGREMVIAVQCPSCDREEELAAPLSAVNVAEARCPACGEIRTPRTTNAVQAGDAWAAWPLARLSVPPLDILEVRGPRGCRWYELSGDDPLLAGGVPAAAVEERV